MAFTHKEAVERALDSQNRKRIKEDELRFHVYQGQLRDEIIASLRKEFILPDTVAQMSHRVVPLNITQKIINKLAMVYRQNPLRTPAEENEEDQRLLDLYAGSFGINQKGKWANRYFKLFKHTLWQPFIDRDKVPRLRTLPSHLYTPLSDDPVQPERPTGIIVHHKMDYTDLDSSRYFYWTDEEFYILNGRGDIMTREMAELNNFEGVNPFDKIPFVYIPENDDGNLIPIPDDDLISMQFVIGALLSDLTYASKNQAWSVWTITGVDQSQTISLNPTSVVTFPEGASLNAVKPEVDIEEMLREVEVLVGMLLTTKNLSVGDISGQIQSNRAASGVAMMIDKSETTEDRMDQEAFFVDAEKRLWDLWAHHMLPVHVQRGDLDSEYVGAFSAMFEPRIVFPDMKPFVGDRELVEIEALKLAQGLTTKRRALQTIFADMGGDEIDDLIAEIEAEGQSVLELLQGSTDGDIPGPEQASPSDQ